jgi:hypothetical protein
VSALQVLGNGKLVNSFISTHTHTLARDKEGSLFAGNEIIFRNSHYESALLRCVMIMVSSVSESEYENGFRIKCCSNTIIVEIFNEDLFLSTDDVAGDGMGEVRWAPMEWRTEKKVYDSIFPRRVMCFLTQSGGK